MNRIFKKHYVWLGLVVIALLASCRANKLDLVEPQKDLTGKWKVIKVVQNSLDITSEVDLSKFVITFDKNTYTLTDPIPFMVSKNGTWSFNDPRYPFSVSFAAEGAASPASSELGYPIIEGKRGMIVSFNTGCEANTYKYTLKQVE